MLHRSNRPTEVKAWGVICGGHMVAGVVVGQCSHLAVSVVFASSVCVCVRERVCVCVCVCVCV